MKQSIFWLSTLTALAAFLSSCDSLEQNINVALEEVERQLVVECYLEPGHPYRLLLTETKGYFDDLDECILVSGATVVIKYNGRADTLEQAPFLGECSLINPNFLPFFNSDRTRFFNYGSSTICPLDYENAFELEVIDERGGRSIKATTRMLPPLPIESVSFSFRQERDTLKASAFVRTEPDNASTANFYRLMLHKRSLYEETGPVVNIAKDPNFDAAISADPLFRGKPIAWGTPYRYKMGDTLIATVYRIEKDFYDYIGAISDSESSNGNPFSQPPAIRSNVEGGLGIFTFLSFDRLTVLVEEE